MFFMISSSPLTFHLMGEMLKRFVIEKPKDELYTSHSGLAIVSSQKKEGQHRCSRCDLRQIRGKGAT